MWEVDEGSFFEPGIERRFSSEFFWGRKHWSLFEGKFLSEMSEARADAGSVVPFGPGRDDFVASG